MNRLLSAPVRLVVAVLSGLVVSGVVGVPGALAVGSSGVYVALGDSYSSGVGTVGEAGSCGRSPSGYAALWAVNHPLTTVTVAACGGATTDDVVGSQLSVLNAQVALVTITVGGNDAGFFPTVMVCVQAADGVCEQQVGAARSVMARVLPQKLDVAYAAIRRAAPNAVVVVMGYPRLFDPTADCPGDGMSTFKRQVLNAAADQLARVIADRASAAGFVYADVRGRFDGHASCTSDAWLNTVSPGRLSDSFHPNAAGYAKGYLPVMAAAAPPGL